MNGQLITPSFIFYVNNYRQPEEKVTSSCDPPSNKNEFESCSKVYIFYLSNHLIEGIKNFKDSIELNSVSEFSVTTFNVSDENYGIQFLNP